MKKTIVLCAFLLGAFVTSNAQIEWGIKGGVNYSSNGDLISEGQSIIDNPDSNVGYHIGLFSKFGGRIYLRPELFYTQISSDYNGKTFKMKKIDVPVLVGLKVIGPLHVFLGPSLQFIIDTDLEDITLGDVESNFTVGGVGGIGLQFGKLGIDVRYETGFTENQVAFLGEGVVGRLDTRPQQIILGASFRF